MKSAVVTGVSSGIGRASAEYLLAEGWRVFGSVRKAADAAALTGTHPQSFTPLVFDVTDESAVRAGAEQVKQALRGAGLDGLVNNAGIANGGPIPAMPLTRMKDMFAVNVFGVHTVTQSFLPLLGAALPKRKDPGRIVMISSVSGKRAVPFNGVYAATKHALEGYSDALRRELMIYGIDVVIVEPGPVKTRIWEKATQIDPAPFRNTDYWPVLERFATAIEDYIKDALPAEEVAGLVHAGLTLPRPRTRYVITPKKLINWILPRLLPDRVVDRAIYRRFGFDKLK